MELPEIFYHCKEQNVLVCKTHGIAVLPDKLAVHLGMHQSLAADKRRTIVDRLAPIVPSLHQRHSDFVLPPVPIEPIEFIPVVDGLMCTATEGVPSGMCRHITTGDTAQKHLRTHIRTHHCAPANVDAAELHGPSATAFFSNRTAAVSCQRLFNHTASGTAAASFFEVTQPRPAATALGSDAFEAMLAGTKKRESEEFASIRDVLPKESDQRHNVSPWLAHTNFAAYVGGESSAELLKLTALPLKKTEPLEWFLANHVSSMVRTWMATCNRSSRHVRAMVMREGGSHSQPTQPLQSYMHNSVSHASSLQAIILCVWRLQHQPPGRLPYFRLTPRQLVAFQALESHVASLRAPYPLIDTSPNRTTLTTTEVLLHNLWLSLLRQKSTLDEKKLSLLTPLAVLGVAPNGYKQAWSYATDLSALKKFARLAFVHQLWLDFEPTIASHDDDVDEEESASALTAEELDALWSHTDDEAEATLLKWSHLWLTVDHATPMQWIISTAKYASCLRYADHVDGFVTWSGDQLTCHEFTLSMSNFRNMIHRLQAQIEKQLCNLCYVNTLDELPPVAHATLSSIESTSRRDNLWSAFDESNDDHFVQLGEWIMRRVQTLAADEKAVAKWRSSLDPTFRNPDFIHRIGDRIRRLNEDMAALAYLTSGAPARGTELTSCRMWNTTGSEMRNVFFLDGLVSLAPRYHKGFNRDKTLKPIHRFLPRPVGDIFVRYMQMVLPFYRRLQYNLPAHCSRDPFATSPMLFPSRTGMAQETADRLSDRLCLITKEALGVGIKLRAMRHICIAIGRKINHKDTALRVVSAAEVQDMFREEEADALEEQAGHGVQIGTSVYAQEVGRIFTVQYKHNLKASTQYHTFLGFVPVEVSAHDNGGNSASWFDNLAAAAPEETSLGHRTDPRHGVKREFDTIRLPELLVRTYGVAARFRGLQEKVLLEVVRGESAAVAYVAATGSGKSLVFELPMKLPGHGMTLLVVPLVALKADLADRLRGLGMRPILWNTGDDEDETADVVITTPEQVATSSSLKAFLQRQRSAQRLSRIVIDEVHYVLQVDPTFRPHIQALGRLTAYGVPLTFLTATLSPDDEAEVWRKLCLDPSSVRVFRESTNRPNLAYRVCHTETPLASDEAIQEHITANVTINEGLQGIVYVTNRSSVTAISAGLRCLGIHGGMTLSERESTMRRFLAGDSRLLIANTACGCGVHNPSVVSVHIYGHPDNPRDAIQQLGRCGRAGQAALAVIVLAPGLHSFLHRASPRDQRWMATLTSSVEQTVTRCRRDVILEYADGTVQGGSVCSPDEQKCDVCLRYLYPNDIAFDATSAVVTLPRSRTVSSPSLCTPASKATSVVSSLPTPPTSVSYETPRRTQAALPTPSSAVVQTSSPTPLQSSPSAPSMHKRQRQLDNMVASTVASARAAGSIYHVRIPAAAVYWQTHCVACFAQGLPWDHAAGNPAALSNCGRIWQQVKEFKKDRLGWTNPGGYCFYCWMPFQCCGRWAKVVNASRDAKAQWSPNHDFRCTYTDVIAPMFVFPWTRNGRFAKAWCKRMEAVDPHSGPDVHLQPKSWARYFSRVRETDQDHRIHQLCADWLYFTEEYFLEGRADELWDPAGDLDSDE